jgi:RNA polymerase sigma-70 factor (ECF subfamily)
LTTDEEAEFTALIERHSRFVFRVAYGVLLNAHDAEDAVQETFLKLYRNGGWRHAENERAFLARVAWRMAVDRRRTIRPNDALPDVEETPWTALQWASPHPGPEQVLAAANQHALVHSLIDALPEELRLPLVLSASDELNSREIATILSIPEGTVRTRLQRARQVLRERIANLQTRKQETHYA